MKTNTNLIPARLGSVSSGTLRTADLLSTFISTLEGLTLVNGGFLSQPENFPMRDRLANLIGEAQDCFAEDGAEIDPDKEDEAAEIVDELQDALNEFAPAYAYFGTHPGDGADFGFWADVDTAREECGFVSSRRQEYPDADYRGEWLHVNDHGNATLYVREDSDNADGYADREVWGVV